MLPQRARAAYRRQLDREVNYRGDSKGCDIGYVLAVGSCEGVNDEEHAPSQPLMRPLLSQFQTPIAPRRAVGFFGSGCPAGCPVGLITQLTLDWRLLGSQPFQPSTAANVIPRHCGVNARIRCNCENSRRRRTLRVHILRLRCELEIAELISRLTGGRSKGRGIQVARERSAKPL